MKIKRLPAILVLLFSQLLLIACSQSTNHVQLASYKELEIPISLHNIPGMRWSLIWSNDLGLSAIVSTSVLRDEQLLVNLEEQTYVPLIFDDRHICILGRRSGFALLPNGDIGYVLSCNSGNTPYLVNFSKETNESTKLVSVNLPGSPALRAYTWSPDMSRGVQAFNDSLSGTIFWLYPDTYKPVELTLHQGGRSWDMAQPFIEPEGDIRGIADSPAWSPDGLQILFFGAAFRDSLTGIAKIGAAISLYSLNPETSELSELQTGFRSPGFLQWSPKGDWVAFIALQDRFSTNASDLKLWLYKVSTDQLFEIGNGSFMRMVWDPTGSQIATLLCAPTTNDAICGTVELQLYDVSEIVGE